MAAAHLAAQLHAPLTLVVESAAAGALPCFDRPPLQVFHVPQLHLAAAGRQQQALLAERPACNGELKCERGISAAVP